LEVTDSFLTFGFYLPISSSAIKTGCNDAKTSPGTEGPQRRHTPSRLHSGTTQFGGAVGFGNIHNHGILLDYVYIYTCICNPTSWDTPLQQWLFSYLQITY
jgi:hypothetical protein